MINYFPKMRIAAYVVGCGIPIGIALVFWFCLGGTIGVGGAGIAVLALLIIMPTLSFNLFNKRADRKMDEILAIYNESCDPEGFIAASSEVVSRMKEPYQEFEAWFMSFYALALLDVGRKDEAIKIGQSMQSTALSTQNPDEKLTMLVNILPLVMRLFGADAALRVIDEAQSIIAANPAPNSADQANYLESQRKMIQAVKEQDADYLINRCQQIRTNVSGNQQMRIRVVEAEREAQVRTAIGDTEGARECWRFVVDNGNKLPCAEEAKKHV